eukprot:12886443-Alexandrium_andersonii.AAC.1
MSASLVGSEMCIRDSVDNKRQALIDGRIDKDVYVCADRGREVGSYRSVSYTHLTLPTICSV